MTERFLDVPGSPTPSSGQVGARAGRRVRLCYEVLGADGDPAVVLVMGLGLQMIWWRDEFCQHLVSLGRRVIRFDHRDVGRSSRMDGAGITAGQFLRRRVTPPYTLGDMAGDVAGLIAATAPQGAHVVGISMGALIAQELAITAPGTVRSLVSIMGRPGDGRSGGTSPRMKLEFLRPVRGSADARIEATVRTFHRIGSRGRTRADDDDVRTLMRRSAERGDDAGGGRQLAAIVGERDRTADLTGLRLPTLVVHGERDRVIRPSGGRATADAIPGARLLMVPGLGHDLPRWWWPQLIAEIAAISQR